MFRTWDTPVGSVPAVAQGAQLWLGKPVFHTFGNMPLGLKVPTPGWGFKNGRFYLDTSTPPLPPNFALPCVTLPALSLSKGVPCGKLNTAFTGTVSFPQDPGFTQPALPAGHSLGEGWSKP